MLRFLSLIVFVSMPFLEYAQSGTYVLERKNDSVQLQSKADTIVFTRYQKTSKTATESSVAVNGGSYKFIVRKTRHGKVKEVVDASGKRVASVFMDNEHLNNIVLSNGLQLNWKRTSNSSWGYFYKTEKAIDVTTYATETERGFVIRNYDSLFNDPVVPAIALEYGTKKFTSKKKPFGVFIVVAGTLAIVRVAMNSADDED